MTQNRVVSTLGDSSIAGKNVLANGDFRIWDTGTTLSNLQNTDVTFMNGWFMAYNGSFATNVISRQSFTVGNEIPGYEAPYYLRWTTTSPTSNTYAYLGQKVSDVRTFAGQTVTLSGWIKASGSISNNYLQFEQNFGNGGSASIYSSSVGPTITTSWQRISLTATLGSISGKTLGPNSFLKTQIVVAGNQAFTVDTWGWQLEAGSVATSFSSGPSGAAISLDPTNLMTQPGGQGYTSYQVAGKNKIINGDFSIWQRGTSIAVTSNNQTSCDRVNHVQDGSGATRTITKQTFTVNTSGNPTGAVNNQNSYFRYAQSVAGTGGTYNLIEQRIEGAVLAGQMVTFSFWAKAAANLTLPQIDYEFTIGGTNSSANITSNVAVTTSWQRFVYTFIMPTYAGANPKWY